ncbi:NAD(P)H-hydrate dehydratase [bacterium]|nr:NAD(P)H-hydrate dehydratase [bacterium]
MKLLTAEQMRRVDEITIRERGVPGSVLMDRAGKAVAREALERFRPDSVAIVTGKGNNAGDGFVVARELAAAGVSVSLYMLAPASELGGDALGAYNDMTGGMTLREQPSAGDLRAALPHHDLVIDAIFGTGTRGGVSGPWADAIEAINASGTRVLSIDIPSGLPCEPPAPESTWGPAVRADLTVTIGRPKLSMAVEPGITHTGRVVVADIGFPSELLDDPAVTTNLITIEEARAMLPPRPADGHKGTFGSVLILAGSEGMTGAAVMASIAAARSGAGLVYVGYPSPLGTVMEGRLLEPVKRPLGGAQPWFGPDHVEAAIKAAEDVDAVAIGPGIGHREQTAEFLTAVMNRINKPLVLDASALTILADRIDLLGGRPAPTILTPHPVEAARLLGKSVGEIQSSRLDSFLEFCARWKCIVALKGAQTVIADPQGQRWVNHSGNTGLAKGGSGDVLTGLIAGLIAQSMPPLDASRLGVFVHGYTADLLAERMSVRAMLASDLIAALGEAWLRLERGK